MVEDQVLDRTYAALSDATRRSVLVSLRDGELRITDLARELPMTFAAVSRHVGVLESAGLVTRHVRGRDHWLSLRSHALSPAETWIHEQTAFWSRRTDALEARLQRRTKASASPGVGRRRERA
jgi:DNA-binding transcriptional ArsR family regulator